MKKIKYLLGFLVFGFGLLFNQSFGIDLELVDMPSDSQYLIQFQNNSHCSSSVCGVKYDYMNYYYKYYVGSVLNTYTYGLQPNDCGTEDCTSYQFNYSMTGLDLYNSSTVHYAARTRFAFNYQYSYGTNINYQTLLGQQQSLGLVYVCPDCFNEVVTGPKFKVGTSFYGSYENVKIVNSTESNYIRLFNQTVTGFDISNINFISGSGFPTDSWEYFTPLQTWTNYGRIATPGYTLGRLGSPLGFGFSSVYTYDTSNTGSVSYNNLKFRTYYDTVIVPLMLMSANNQWILLDSDLSGFYFDGVLILPANSYNSGQSLGEYVIAKDPLNPTQVMYELYSCLINTYPINNTGDCIKLDAGYITYNGSKDVLPFENYNDSYSLSSTPLLQDLSSYRIYTEQTSNGFKIVNHYYGFLTDPNVNILATVESFESDSHSGSGSLVENCVNTEVCRYSSGSNGEDIKYCTNQCLTSDIIQSGSYVGTNGTIYYVNSSLNIDNLLDGNEDFLYNPIYLDSGGFLSLDYFSGLFDGSSSFKLGVCPYPQSNFLSFVTKFKIGNFYPLMPLNCFVSAFQQGARITYFDEFGLFPDNHSQILYGNSRYHRTLFNFFDILLSIGILFILSSLHRLIKK